MHWYDDAMAKKPRQKLGHPKWQYSTEIDDQYRLCFNWHKQQIPYNIEITKHYESI